MCLSPAGIGGAVMVKSSVLAMFVLALMFALGSPSKASAQVAFGVRIGPVYAPPAYGYVYAHPRPYYYARPYAYAPAYVYPGYGYSGYVDRDRRSYYRRDWDRRDEDRDEEYRGRRERGEGWRR